MLKTFFGILALSVALALPTAGQSKEEQDARTYRFGLREIDLPQRLQNDEMRFKNHGLENDIARLEERPEDIDLVRITVDRFLIDQDRAAIKVANWFAQVWSNTGDKELQRKLSVAEKQFDEADEKCHSDDEALDKSTVPVTLEAAEANCTTFHKTYLAVSQYQIKVSVPSPTIFKHNNAVTSTGENLLRTDSLQLKLDMAAHRLPKISKTLIQDDQMLINADKMIWAMEISHTNSELLNEMKAHRQRLGDIMKTSRHQILNIQKGR